MYIPPILLTDPRLAVEFLKISQQLMNAITFEETGEIIEIVNDECNNKYYTFNVITCYGTNDVWAPGNCYCYGIPDVWALGNCDCYGISDVRDGSGFVPGQALGQKAAQTNRW